MDVKIQKPFACYDFQQKDTFLLYIFFISYEFSFRTQLFTIGYSLTDVLCNKSSIFLLRERNQGFKNIMCLIFVPKSFKTLN